MYPTTARAVAWVTDRGSHGAHGLPAPSADLEVTGLALTAGVVVTVSPVTEVLGVVGVLVWVIGLVVLITLDISRRARRRRGRRQPHRLSNRRRGGRR